MNTAQLAIHAQLQRSRALSSAEIMRCFSSPFIAGLLQRSRALSSAEMNTHSSIACGVMSLQRSRALSSAEIIPKTDAAVSLGGASTEPRSFERGDRPTLLPRRRLRLASTEPRSFERGDTSRNFAARLGSSGFNGAALFRARRL